MTLSKITKLIILPELNVSNEFYNLVDDIVKYKPQINNTRIHIDYLLTNDNLSIIKSLIKRYNKESYSTIICNDNNLIDEELSSYLNDNNINLLITNLNLLNGIINSCDALFNNSDLLCNLKYKIIKIVPSSSKLNLLEVINKLNKTYDNPIIDVCTNLCNSQSYFSLDYYNNIVYNTKYSLLNEKINNYYIMIKDGLSSYLDNNNYLSSKIFDNTLVLDTNSYSYYFDNKMIKYTRITNIDDISYLSSHYKYKFNLEKYSNCHNCIYKDYCPHTDKGSKSCIFYLKYLSISSDIINEFVNSYLEEVDLEV